MDLRVFVEPQQGATYLQQLTVAQTAERARLRRLLPVRPLPEDGRHDRPAGPHRRVGHPRRHRPRDPHHPPRHPRHLGHVPPARAPRHLRRPGRRHERRPGRARPRCRLVRRRAHRLRHPVPRARGALRPPRGAARDHHRAVAHAGRLAVHVRGRALRPRRLPGAAQAGAAGRAARSSSAATAPRARPVWRRTTPTSSTCRSLPSRRSPPSGPGSSRPARTAAATPRRWSSPPPWCCAAARTTARSSAAPATSAGRPTSCARTAAAGTPSEVLDKIATYAEAGAERIYLQVLDMDDLDHLRLVADQVKKLLP